MTSWGVSAPEVWLCDEKHLVGELSSMQCSTDLLGPDASAELVLSGPALRTDGLYSISMSLLPSVAVERFAEPDFVTTVR
jgi:hypothetical protein